MKEVLSLRQWLAVGLVALLLLGPGIPAGATGERTTGVPAPAQAVHPAAPDQATWHVEIVNLHGGDDPALALDAQGQPRIAYFGYDAADRYGLLYSRYENFTWHTEVVDENGGEYVSLALDALDNPHLSYYSSRDADLLYAHYYSGSWHIQHVDTTGDVGEYTSIGVDAEGMPHISYWDSTNEAVKYAHRVGADWQTETLATVGGYGDDTSLALDAAGHPHISYRDDTMDSLRHAYHDGTSWHLETVDSEGSYTGEQSSIALDAQGHPRIAYSCDGLCYAEYDGTSWHITILDSDWLAGDNVSLALESSGRPHISFTTWNYPDESWLRHAWFDGFDWQAETVDVRAFVGGGFEGTSLALGPDGRPQIAYYDMGGDNLKYAAFREPCTPISAASIGGPARLPIGVAGQYQASYTPAEATPPVLYAWDNGAVGATASYSWPLAGDYSVAVTATNACGQVHAALPVQVFCQPLTGVHIGGPLALLVGRAGTFLAVPEPITASLPLSFAWDNGGSDATAQYSWPAVGTYTLTVTATNGCGAERQASLQVRVLEEWPYQVFMPIVLR